MAHKAGFVNIIGHPNVGKSTLMNQLVGEQLSIITSKAQTTRHRILGIVNEEDYQIVYSDTPGIIDPAYKMQEGMMKFVYSSLKDADVVVLLIECGQKELKDEKLNDFLIKTKIPIITVINKVDLSNQELLEQEMIRWKDKLPNSYVLPISALHGFNVDQLKAQIIKFLPENPPYYPKDSLTDKSERFFVEEKVREKILLHYDQEVPYSVEIQVEEFKEEEEIIRIRAIIYVSRESQKGILIGKGGSMLKIVGSESRKDLEQFFAKKIYLELYVKVNKDWRNDDKQLKKFGYL
ncbi:MAG: GTPase Era [Bacteroidetes bacterium]|nr:MAG: GTPase Era [Bacteroidota bacterium]MBL1144787.1 GTPase Era [Bacteroidota bacterium]MCB0802048.1 GTPase Era [Flavobacteriales bacterium]NOG57581.1 GTPase Era [Bacteroidota bacterium]